MVYIWNNGNDCSSGKKNANIKRELEIDECNVFLNDTDTNLGYTIYAEVKINILYCIVCFFYLFICILCLFVN